MRPPTSSGSVPKLRNPGVDGSFANRDEMSRVICPDPCKRYALIRENSEVLMREEYDFVPFWKLFSVSLCTVLFNI
jgi:hypothetical protein